MALSKTLGDPTSYDDIRRNKFGRSCGLHFGPRLLQSACCLFPAFLETSFE